MRVQRLAAIICLLFPAACAETRMAADYGKGGDYVEITNPAFTLSPGSPATIWVPRNSVDHGLPRGGTVLQKGYDSLVDGIAGANPPVPAASDSSSRSEEQFREHQFR